MKRLLSYAFSLDSGCVELHYSDRSMLAIDCTTVENSIETNTNGYAELDRLLNLLRYDTNAPKRWLNLLKSNAANERGG